MKTQTSLLEAVLDLHKSLREFSLQPQDAVSSTEHQQLLLDFDTQRTEYVNLQQAHLDLQTDYDNISAALETTLADLAEAKTIADDYAVELQKQAAEQHNNQQLLSQLQQQLNQLGEYYKTASASVTELRRELDAAQNTAVTKANRVVELEAELERLQLESVPPSGYKTWQDAAVTERMRRTQLQLELNATTEKLSRLTQLLQNALK